MSARSSLLTVLGEFVLNTGAEVWTSTLVESLGLLGFGEQNARQATARLLEQGTLDRAAHGRRTRWSLTESGRQLLTDGERRIYAFLGEPEPWDGRWLLVLSSLPDSQRASRHQLRRRLGFLGFGSLTPGVMVSPHTGRERQAGAVLEALDLDSSAFLLRAQSTALAPPDRLIATAWDLPALADRYKVFVERFESERPTNPAETFVALTELVDTWRRFPFADPEIPPELLGDGWSGTAARSCFDDCHRRWNDAARAWFAEQERVSSQ